MRRITEPAYRKSVKRSHVPGPSFLEPLQDTAGGAYAGGETGLHEVTTGRCLPVEHFAGDERAGATTKHETIVDLAEGDATRGRDGSIDRDGANQPQRQRVDQAGERGCIKHGELAGADFMQ